MIPPLDSRFKPRAQANLPYELLTEAWRIRRERFDMDKRLLILGVVLGGRLCERYPSRDMLVLQKYGKARDYTETTVSISADGESARIKVKLPGPIVLPESDGWGAWFQAGEPVRTWSNVVEKGWLKADTVAKLSPEDRADFEKRWADTERRRVPAGHEEILVDMLRLNTRAKADMALQARADEWRCDLEPAKRPTWRQIVAAFPVLELLQVPA